MAIYLDYAAATPVDPDVIAAMQPFFNDQFYNPSALYGPAVEAARALEEARSAIAGLLGAKPPEIIFTAGGTEANNLAVHGIMRGYPESAAAISAIEHDSVRVPAIGYKSQIIPVNEKGLVDPADIPRVIGGSTVLVSVMYANNEVGTVQPIRRISAEIQLIRKERARQGNKLPLYLHVDAAQAGNYLDMHVHRLGADMMTVNGGKLYGPKQTGILFVRRGINLTPVIEGGGQERNLRSGTENVAGAAGLAKALSLSVDKRHDESARLQKLQARAVSLLHEAFPEVIVNGSLKFRLPNNLHITLPNIDNERILMALDMEGVYAAAGSACSAGNDEPSHVLTAMGFNNDYARSSLRFSMGRPTSESDIVRLVTVLKQLV